MSRRRRSMVPILTQGWHQDAVFLELTSCCVQVLVPVAFFGIMCIPKHYIPPQPRPREIISRAYDLDMGLTSKPGSAEYFGASAKRCFTDKSLFQFLVSC